MMFRLGTWLQAVKRPAATSARKRRGERRTHPHRVIPLLEALEDRRLLSHGFGLDDVQPVEIERPEPSGDTPSVSRGLDDTAAVSRGLDDNTIHLGGVSDRRGRGNEGETGGGRRHAQPANSLKNFPPHRRHGAGEHVILVIHA